MVAKQAHLYQESQATADVVASALLPSPSVYRRFIPQRAEYQGLEPNVPKGPLGQLLSPLCLTSALPWVRSAPAPICGLWRARPAPHLVALVKAGVEFPNGEAEMFQAEPEAEELFMPIPWILDADGVPIHNT